ncbi:hypothetical protein LCGC14_1966700 [marine sediment metagenome]|uniref:Uncharacterized protein n=1 Tax=marine sediment metagenome TaxID=412755 RepID=A0A0F9FCW9_9ZZZZ|nr:hypothetical protein [Actinomycetota bacterium]
MLDIDKKDKIDILLNQLNERYNALHKMRERSLSFVIWILGFGIAVIWVVLTKNGLAPLQRSLLMILIVIVGALTAYFIRAIERGFTTNKKIAGDIEQALGFHTKGFFVEKNTILPQEYEKGNQNPVWSGHFPSLYIWLAAISLMTFLIVGFSPPKQQGSSLTRDNGFQGQVNKQNLDNNSTSSTQVETTAAINGPRR